MPNFVHLHLHTEYSLSDSLVRIKSLVKSVHETGMPACAITDQSNLFGLVKFYRAAQAAGIKPIIGVDVWIYDNKKPSRLVLLCQNNIGYKNLTRLVSRSYTEGQIDNIPYLYKNWLEDNTDGLIALSGGREGEIGELLLSGENATQKLEQWNNLFPQRFYLELQRIGRPNEEEYIHTTIDLALATNTPVVATNNVRFLNSNDYEAHELRVCIHAGKVVADPNRPKNYTPQQYLRTPQEMAELFADIPEAIENTWLIAQRCNLELTLGKNFLPDFPIPEGQTIDEYFRQKSRIGLEQRLATLFDKTDETFPEQRKPYDERLAIELDVILQMGFPGYFLIVADFIQWAKDNDVPVGPGRGSGAGSLVAYVLNITDLDPIRYELLFERFLNPERVSMPDFDIDFCMEGRDDVINYVAEHYGRDKVSQIITYGTMAAKAVVRDVGRVLAHPHGFVDKIAKLIPFEIGITLEKALDKEPLLRTRYEQEEEVRALIDKARQLEGLTRNVGTHAGGVVISPTKLTDFTPLYCEQDSQDLISQFDKNDVEAVGLVKFDFLGLRTLTVIKWALQTINHFLETPIDILKIPLNDAATYDLLKRGDTTAVFQLESGGLKKLIRRLQPDTFEDIVALVALYRPGPLQSGMVDDFVERKHGRAKIEYPHPDLAQVLKPTYGVIVYQEQVMQIAQILAGYSLGGADLLRRYMGKKDPEQMAKQRSVFTEGAIARNVSEEQATYTFNLIQNFAEYGFNKSLDINTKICTIEGIKLIKDCKAGDKVISRTSMGESVYTNIIALHNHGEVPLWEIKFDDNTIERCTLDHKWLTETGQQPLWKIIQMGSKVWGCAANSTDNEGTSKRLSRLFEQKKEIPLDNEMWSGTTYQTRYSCSSETMSNLYEYDSYRPFSRQRTQNVLWGGCMYTEKYNGPFEKLCGMSTSTTQNQSTDLQKLRTYSRNASKIFNNCKNNISTSGYTETTCRTTKTLARYSSRRIPTNLYQSSSITQTLQNGNMVRTSSSQIRFYSQCSYVLWAKMQTGRFCQSASKNGNRSRWTLAFSTNQFPSKFRKSARTRPNARTRNSTTILAINPNFDGRIQKQLWNAYLSRSQPTVEYHQRWNMGRDTVLRQPIRATFMGWGQSYDLEVDHPEHNFLLASGLCCSNSHSAAYALVSYQTAWLKAHYPAAFMAAVLSADMDNTEKLVPLVEECRSYMKLQILPPHVNVSKYKFTVTDDENKAIRYGLGAIKGAGEAALESIVTERKEGKFTDLFDFCRRIDLRKASRRVLEPLIKCGALDELGPNRATMLSSLETAIKSAERHSKDRATGQNDIFTSFSKIKVKKETPFVKNIDEWKQAKFLNAEKESLGFYLSGHPIEPYLFELSQLTRNRLANIKLTGNKQNMRIAGLVTELRINRDKRGRQIAFVTLDDSTARMDVKIYSELYGTIQNILVKDTLLVAEGEVRVDDYNGGYAMTGRNITTFETARENHASRVEINVIAEQTADKEFAPKLVAVLNNHRQGRCLVVINYKYAETQVELVLGNDWRVKPNAELLEQLQELVGDNKVKVIY